MCFPLFLHSPISLLIDNLQYRLAATGCASDPLVSQDQRDIIIKAAPDRVRAAFVAGWRVT